MKKRTILFAITIILLFILIVLSSFKYNLNNKNTNEDNKKFSYTPPMYKICDNDSCIYLLGSIHTGDDKVNKFNSIIIDAYKESDKLAVELDINDISLNVSDFISENGSLEDYITPDLNNKLQEFSSNHSLFPYNTLKYMKLGYIYDYISLLPYLENDFKSEGVDNYFINLASEDKKAIISLETYEDQLNLLIGYSNEFYIKELEEIIDNYDEVKEMSINLYESYLKGDVKELKKLIDEDTSGSETEEEKEYLKNVYDDRNIYMASRVEEFLANNDKVFMVVGSAHVIGNNGIIEILSDKYKISIVK